MEEFFKKFSGSAAIKIIIGGGIGYSLFKMTSSPTSKLHNRLPEKEIKNVSFLPNIKISRRDKTYHMHHWMNLSVLYIFLLMRRKRVLRSKFLNGLIIGGIVQGLSYKDRFKIIKYTKQITDGHDN